MSTTITVEGMSCGHCEQTVEEALQDVPGVTDVAVDRETDRAHVDGDADTSTLVDAVENAGYTAHV
ncbi:heavy-metal-associated domain-containing protein [Haloarcula sp. S1AR25-5A]|uniref:Heavy-metal-associated domain-containing protein n=1 Tax=Haloarcula terrestris TaxID=2950533 RepID=A0AAE4EZV9_9EURY|nr:heavy metal-associated domain-containing protein [Haloarcula terrestris]MDS0222429.1 heavy-metal-associated domain-containing protein [Haloarcula terrestris]